MKLLLCAAFLSVLLSGSKVGAQGPSADTCPLLGSDVDTRFSQTRSTSSGLYMNFGAPAQCNGTVTSLQYCYYNNYPDDECDDPISYRSTVVVYRKTGTSTYMPVPGASRSITLRLRCPVRSRAQLPCGQVTLTEQFSVQENDIIAACLPRSRSVEVVGADSGPSMGVYEYDRANGFGQCSDAQLPTVDTQSSGFSQSGGQFRLHLYAEVNNQIALNGGSNPPPSTPYTNSGTFINTNSPISASNTITSWHYCYYPSETPDNQATYTATVGVWRLNPATNQYELLPGSDGTLSLAQPKDTPAKIACQTKDLEPQDYLPVQVGDVVGVSLPEQNPLPVVSTDSTGFGLQVINAPMTAPAALQVATLNSAPDMALHLFPTVEFVPTVVGPVGPVQPVTTAPGAPDNPVPAGNTEDPTWPTTEWLVTEWPTTERMTDDNGEALQETAGSGIKSLNRGYYVAIGLGALLVIVILVVVVGIVVYKMRKHRNKKATLSFNEQMQEGFEASMSQRGLLTSSFRPNNGVPYYTKDDHHINQGGFFTASGGSTASIPDITKDKNIIAHDPYDLLMPHDSQLSLVASNEVPDQPYDLLRNHSSLLSSNEGFYSKLGASAEYSILLEQVMEGKSFEGEEDPYYSPATRENELYVQLKTQGIKMIKHNDIEITGVLGEGQFGSVSKGIWREETGYILEVAVKSLKPNSDEKDKVKFLQEAAIMAQFRHPNVVTLYGVASSRGAVMIVVELLPNGDLQQHLIGMKSDPELLIRSFTPRKLLGFCQQVALGMQYLSAKGFIHRDLAARNILISEGGICKIADFGMSIDLAEDNYYVSKGGRIPLKWTAPEALHYRKYSTASDVWSYGCLLYEIWSLGQKPFGTSKNRKVIQQLDLGYRLPPPPGCPKAIYKLMIDCWHPSTAERPGFRSILLDLLDKEDYVLKIPNEVDKNTPAAILGAPLEAAYNMYTQLQTSYRDDYVSN